MSLSCFGRSLLVGVLRGKGHRASTVRGRAMASVEISKVAKTFGETAVLRSVSLSIEKGEFLTLVGPSGCGKTTLLRIIAGLETQDSGAVKIAGIPVDHLPPKRRDVAMVFQNYALYPYMTVAENMALPLVMRRFSALQRLPLLGRLLPGTTPIRAGIDAEVGQVARSLAIDHLLSRRPAQLSGGQRQRVALGRAMVRNPQIFLMDEPLSNLDAKLRVQTRTEIAELHRRLGATFVYVTHDQVEAMTMSSRVAVMLEGDLHQVAPPQEIYDAPADLAVAGFIGTPKINLLPAQVRGDGAFAVLDRVWPLPQVEALAGGYTLGVRPEAWTPLRAGGRVALCAMGGIVRHIELLGSETLVHFAVEGLQQPLVARVDPMVGATLRLADAVTFGVSPERVHVFDAQGRRVPRRDALEFREAAVG